MTSLGGWWCYNRSRCERKEEGCCFEHTEHNEINKDIQEDRSSR